MANIPFYKGQNLNIIANLANSIKFDKTKKNKLNATNVQDAIDEIAEGAGITNVTRAQYNALTEAQKNSGTYFITDEAEIGDAASVSYVNDGTSLTSTNVQGAISELNDTISEMRAYKSGETVDLSSYTTKAGRYVFPADGYVMLNSKTATSGLIRANITDSIGDAMATEFMNITGTYQVSSVYVRKGMGAYLDSKATNATAEFRPFV